MLQWPTHPEGEDPRQFPRGAMLQGEVFIAAHDVAEYLRWVGERLAANDFPDELSRVIAQGVSEVVKALADELEISTFRAIAVRQFGGRGDDVLRAPSDAD